MSASDGDCQAIKVKAHEAHKIGSSLLLKNLAIQQELKVGAWSSQSMFSGFYLRDVTHSSMETFSIGFVVATLEVV